MALRVRVLPAVSRKGLYPLAAGIGLTHGLLGSWLVIEVTTRLESAWPFSFNSWQMSAIAVALFALPAVVSGLIVSRVHPRLGRMLLLALCYSPTCMLGLFSTIVAKHPEIMLMPWQMGSAASSIAGGTAMFVGVVGVYVLVASGLLMGLFVTVHWLERWLGRTSLQQTGLICWSCGYNLGAPSITVCPECGRAFDPAADPQIAALTIVRGLSRRGRTLLLLACAAGAGLWMHTLATHTIPCAQFLWACPTAGKLDQVISSHVYSRGGTDWRDFAQPISLGWWLSDEGSETVGISVQFLPESRDEEGRVFVGRACRVAMGSGAVPDPRWICPGTTSVFAKLTPKQADEMIAQGAVPSSLLKAIKSAAETAGWRECSYTTPTKGETVVDPAQHFQPEKH